MQGLKSFVNKHNVLSQIIVLIMSLCFTSAIGFVIVSIVNRLDESFAEFYESWELFWLFLFYMILLVIYAFYLFFVVRCGGLFPHTYILMYGLNISIYFLIYYLSSSIPETQSEWAYDRFFLIYSIPYFAVLLIPLLLRNFCRSTTSCHVTSKAKKIINIAVAVIFNLIIIFELPYLSLSLISPRWVCFYVYLFFVLFDLMLFYAYAIISDKLPFAVIVVMLAADVILLVAPAIWIIKISDIIHFVLPNLCFEIIGLAFSVALSCYIRKNNKREPRPYKAVKQQVDDTTQ